MESFIELADVIDGPRTIKAPEGRVELSGKGPTPKEEIEARKAAERRLDELLKLSAEPDPEEAAAE